MSNTNTTKAPTKRDQYNALLAIPAVQENQALVDFITHELELLDKKNAANRKPTQKQLAKQAADADLRNAIVNEMEMGTVYSADDLLKTLPTLAATPDLSAAKVNYLMRALIADGSVVRTVDKRHTFYSLAE